MQVLRTRRPSVPAVDCYRRSADGRTGAIREICRDRFRAVGVPSADRAVGYCGRRFPCGVQHTAACQKELEDRADDHYLQLCLVCSGNDERGKPTGIPLMPVIGVLYTIWLHTSTKIRKNTIPSKRFDG